MFRSRLYRKLENRFPTYATVALLVLSSMLASAGCRPLGILFALGALASVCWGLSIRLARIP